MKDQMSMIDPNVEYLSDMRMPYIISAKFQAWGMFLTLEVTCVLPI